MSSLNKVLPGSDHRIQSGVFLAGGAGAPAARQSSLQQLRRVTMACMLWEDNAYESGATTAKAIQEAVKKCDPTDVANLAVEIRSQGNLRHVPLLLARELFREPSSRVIAGQALPRVIQRADEITEFLAIYWKEGKTPLAAQVKKGLAQALAKFDEYQLAKYKDSGKNISLRDVMFLVHAKPKGQQGTRKLTKYERKQKQPLSLTPQEELYRRLAANELETPDTREVLLSAAKTTAEKKAAYVKLIEENKLGPQALLMNLRGMDELGVPREMIRNAVLQSNPRRILPLQFFSARTHAPQFADEIEQMMFKSLRSYPKLPGHSVFVVDVSGSMSALVSAKSGFTRLHGAIAMAIMAAEMCEKITIYATAGSDPQRKHRTKRIVSRNGWGLASEIERDPLGGGGIFTRQCLEYIEGDMKEDAKSVDRIMIFSDSQDCDHSNRLLKPKPFGKKNYIIDVGANKNGINYAGVWTAEISGWSQQFLSYIAESEALEQEETQGRIAALKLGSPIPVLTKL